MAGLSKEIFSTLPLDLRLAPALALGTHVLPAVIAVCAPSDIRHEDVARIVHDFKNPLATIALEAELLEQRVASADPHDVRRAAGRIARNVEFLDRMVMDLLDLCSFEAGHFDLRCAPTNLRELLEHVIERVVSSRDTGRVSLEAGSREVVDLDDLRIERVVANLIQNAMKYAPAKSRIVVRLEREPTLVRVSVLDQGSALSISEMAYIFDAYRRVQNLSQIEGSGLGLYVSKRIIEAHGGTIGVDKSPDGTTRFFFELPTAPVLIGLHERASDAVLALLSNEELASVSTAAMALTSGDEYLDLERLVDGVRHASVPVVVPIVLYVLPKKLVSEVTWQRILSKLTPLG
jgi:signal transduction histidine kinase